jgi:hypothetical protein
VAAQGGSGVAPCAVRYVVTKAIAAAVKGRETDILGKLGIAWRNGRQHISCPYPDHDDRNPSWRFDNKTGRALCTCIAESKSDGIFEIVMKVKRLDFEAAKIQIAEFIDRSDLIKSKGSGTGQKTDAASLLNPPPELRDDSLVALYLAARLGLDDPAAVPVPTTKIVGLQSLAYFDLPTGKEKKLHLVGSYPCAVFETIARDGRRHAHRIYLSADGTGKAELGTLPNGKSRDPKKSAMRLDGQPSTAGCCVVWGDVHTAAHEIGAEGIETAAAIAYAFAAEIAKHEIVVLSGITAVGTESLAPWPAARTVTIAADRDEAKQGAGFKRGERAARTFALRAAAEGVTNYPGLTGSPGANRSLPEEWQQPILQLALPGTPGTNTDFLDLLRADGIAGVRTAVLAAEPIVPTPEEIAKHNRKAALQTELELIETTYPLPLMETLRVEYRPGRHNGVWIHKIALRENRETGEKEEVATPVCSPFGAVALLVLKDLDEAYGLRVAVRDMNGGSRIVEFDRADLARLAASEIRARLMAAGLRIEQDGDSIVAQLLKAAKPITVISAVHRAGWHQRDLIFTTEGREPWKP